MAVAIRLKRCGRKKKPVYRVVITDQRNPRDGKTIEECGFYNPTIDPIEFRVDEDRVKYWLSVGAQPTDTVGRLLANAGLIPAKKRESSNQKVSKKDREKSDSDD